MDVLIDLGAFIRHEIIDVHHPKLARLGMSWAVDRATTSHHSLRCLRADCLARHPSPSFAHRPASSGGLTHASSEPHRVSSPSQLEKLVDLSESSVYRRRP